MLGIFITGPAAALLGAILGVAVGAMNVSAATAARLLAGAAALVAATTLYFSVPEPRYYSDAVEGEIVACTAPEDLRDDAVKRLNELAANRPALPTSVVWDDAFRQSAPRRSRRGPSGVPRPVSAPIPTRSPLGPRHAGVRPLGSVRCHCDVLLAIWRAWVRRLPRGCQRAVQRRHSCRYLAAGWPRRDVERGHRHTTRSGGGHRRGCGPDSLTRRAGLQQHGNVTGRQTLRAEEPSVRGTFADLVKCDGFL